MDKQRQSISKNQVVKPTVSIFLRILPAFLWSIFYESDSECKCMMKVAFLQKSCKVKASLWSIHIK